MCGARNPLGTKELFSCKSSPKSPVGLLVVGLSMEALSGFPLLPPSMDLWFGLWTLPKSEHVQKSPAGWLLGWLWVLFRKLVRIRVFQPGEFRGEPGGKAEAVVHLLRPERGLVCSHFCSGRGAAVSRCGRPECAIHGPEAFCLQASGASSGLPWELLLGSWMHT